MQSLIEYSSLYIFIVCIAVPFTEIGYIFFYKIQRYVLEHFSMIFLYCMTELERSYVKHYLTIKISVYNISLWPNASSCKSSMKIQKDNIFGFENFQTVTWSCYHLRNLDSLPPILQITRQYANVYSNNTPWLKLKKCFTFILEQYWLRSKRMESFGCAIL